MTSPGSVVLAKVKGYAAWPAMVLDVEVLPENVLALKPKHGVHFTPVRFFADDTYIWIKNGDLKELTGDAIQTYLEKHDDTFALNGSKEDESKTIVTESSETRDSKSDELSTKEVPAKAPKKKSKKELLLLEAYRLANDPPPMDLFVKYGSAGEPPEVELEVEEDDSNSDIVEEEKDDVSYEEEVPKTPKKSKKRPSSAKSKTPAKKQKATSKGASSKTKTSLTKTPSSKKVVSKKTSKVDPKNIPKKEVVKVEPEEEYDSDWGVEETVQEQRSAGNYVFEDSKQQLRFMKTFPASLDIVTTFNKYKSIFEELELELTKDLLLQEEGFEKDVEQKLSAIDKVVDHIPNVLFNKSRLLKVLIVTVRNPNFTNELLRKKIQKLLQNKVGLTVRMNNEDDIQRIEDDIKRYNGTSTSTPATLSVANSKNGTPIP